jgi:hypothetical protein
MRIQEAQKTCRSHGSGCGSRTLVKSFLFYFSAEETSSVEQRRPLEYLFQEVFQHTRCVRKQMRRVTQLENPSF